MNPRLMKLDVCTTTHTYICTHTYTHTQTHTHIIDTHNTCTYGIKQKTETEIHDVHIDTQNIYAYIYIAYKQRDIYRHTYHTYRYIFMLSPRIRGSCYTY